MHPLSIFTFIAGPLATVSASTVTFTFYGDGNCQGNVQDGPIIWSDTDGIHNVVLIGGARTGAASVSVQCNDDGTGDNFDCITAYYAGQYGTDFLGTYYGLGCVNNFTDFIESAGFFNPGTPVSKRSIDDVADPFPRNPKAADSLTKVYPIKRQQNSDPHQRGVYNFDPTYRVEWDAAPGVCPATTLELDEALNIIAEQFRYDSRLNQRGTVLHQADIIEDWSGNPSYTLSGEYTLDRSTSFHEAGIWHSIWDSTFSRLYRNGGVGHIGGITLFLYVQGVHVGSAVYNIQRNR